MLRPLPMANPNAVRLSESLNVRMVRTVCDHVAQSRSCEVLRAEVPDIERGREGNTAAMLKNVSAVFDRVVSDPAHLRDTKKVRTFGHVSWRSAMTCFRYLATSSRGA